jgi:trans-2-enoyl-CoA reductase
MKRQEKGEKTVAIRGSIAKQKVTEKIAQAFGNDYVGEIDKKLYVWADDAGERVQIAISMTCPKAVAAVDEGIDFEKDEVSQTTITPQEQINIQELMARLGL